MPTDYAQICEENIRRYGTETAHLALLGDLYSERTHFIFELLQNAEDAKASEVQFQLGKGSMELSHNGRPFSPEDVRGIASICRSTNQGDPERIGRFGIGFKSVYAYTSRPEIHSGDEHFAIQHYVRPQPTSPRHAENGATTLIVLPFNAVSVPAPEAHREILSAFTKLDPINLLFLRRIQRVELLADNPTPTVLQRKLLAQLAKHVRMIGLSSSDAQVEEQRWLVFDRLVNLITPTGREVEAHVEAAFAVTADSSKKSLKIVCRPRATLAVFFPTDRPTATGFILQGPYIPTPARDNIRRNDPTNIRLGHESAELIVEALRWLRDYGALSSHVLTTLPLKRSDFAEESLFRPLFDGVLKAVKEESLLPAWTNKPGESLFVSGQTAKASNSADLRELLADGLLAELAGPGDWRWLEDNLTVLGDSELARYLREEVGVREITVKEVVSWLETKDSSWWKALEEPWLVRLYRYLYAHKGAHKTVKKLPIIRIESGEHVSAEKQAVFFPATNPHEADELAPFLPTLPVARQSLIDSDEDKVVESFLKQMGVVPLVASEFIKRHVIPRYRSTPLPTVKENRSHLRFLKQAAVRMSAEEFNSLVAELQGVAVLVCTKSSDSKSSYYVQPTKAYLPASLTDEDSLGLFFRASPETWFVDPGYRTEKEKPEEWRQFFLRLGAADSPRVTETDEWHRKDRVIDGLEAALDGVAGSPQEQRIGLSKAIWSVVTGLLPGEGDYAEYKWDQFLQGRQAIFGPRGGYHGSRDTSAQFFVLMRDKAWVPDLQSELHRPCELFEGSKFNRELLGEAVLYLHPKITLKGTKREWLSGKLGIRRSPTKESVLSRLKALKGTSATLAETRPLYEFLDRTRADVGAELEQEALIFCPSCKPRWLKPSQAFWEDESAVFGATRGYLKKHYPELRDFFIRIGVTPSAGPEDCATALTEIASAGTADDLTRSRIHRICKRLAQRLEEGGDWQDEETWKTRWDQLLEGPNWLGRLAEKHGFWRPGELVRMDNEHHAGLFDGKLPFWPFHDLHEFAAQQLEIIGCSSVDCRFQPVDPGDVAQSLSEALKEHWSFVVAFLHSDRWKPYLREGAGSALDGSPTVRQASRIAVTYELMGVRVEEPEGKNGFFEAQSRTLWLAKGLDTDDLAEAIGDALQEFFGPEVLREFVCDLFRKGSSKSIEKWRKKGLILSQPPATELPGKSTEEPSSQVTEAKSSANGQTAHPPDSESAPSTPMAQAHEREGNSSGQPSPSVGQTGAPNRQTAASNEATPKTLSLKGEDLAVREAEGLVKSDSAQTPAPITRAVTAVSGEAPPDGQMARNQMDQHDPSAPSKNLQEALQNAFNKQGKTSITDDRPESGAVRNPAERRKRTRDNYSQRKAHEVPTAQRIARQVIDVWDPKNKAIRDFLYEEYGGRCQICGEVNRFPRRDGRAYFEAVYLIPHTQAAWTDEPGSVICLCALCSAKFQHGAVECQNIAAQIRAQKTAVEGGQTQPSVSLRLIGKPAHFTFSERHLIEVQELLGIAEVEGNIATLPAANGSLSLPPSTAPTSTTVAASAATQSGLPKYDLVQCQQCHPKAPWVRKDRLQGHILRAHTKRSRKGTGGSKSFSVGSSSLRRCRSCGGLAVPGDDYCYSCK